MVDFRCGEESRKLFMEAGNNLSLMRVVLKAKYDFILGGLLLAQRRD